MNWVAYINNRHLFLSVLGAGKSKIRVPVDSVSGNFIGNRLLAMSSYGGRGKGTLLGFLKESTNPIHEGLILPLNTIVLGIRF